MPPVGKLFLTVSWLCPGEMTLTQILHCYTRSCTLVKSVQHHTIRFKNTLTFFSLRYFLLDLDKQLHWVTIKDFCESVQERSTGLLQFQLFRSKISVILATGDESPSFSSSHTSQTGSHQQGGVWGCRLAAYSESVVVESSLSPEKQSAVFAWTEWGCQAQEPNPTAWDTLSCSATIIFPIPDLSSLDFA